MVLQQSRADTVDVYREDRVTHSDRRSRFFDGKNELSTFGFTNRDPYSRFERMRLFVGNDLPYA